MHFFGESFFKEILAVKLNAFKKTEVTLVMLLKLLPVQHLHDLTIGFWGNSSEYEYS